MKKSDIIQTILDSRYLKQSQKKQATAYAPTNIALVKYWGKRQQDINLPVTSSLSISLKDKGAKTTLTQNDKHQDTITLNHRIMDLSTNFSQRLIAYLDLFRKLNTVYFDVNIEANIPIAAGLASSACGFAALAKVLNELYAWQLTSTELSILARLGSGSASRSLWDGFVEWQAGEKHDGMDSYGIPLNVVWPDFCIGLLIMQTHEKNLSSREAMQRTIQTSSLYSLWPEKVNHDLISLRQAIQEQNFALLGKTAESNAMTMHALMLSAWPPISYALPETIAAMQKIWQLRDAGLEVYFTQDAGPNLKLLFLKKDSEEIKKNFLDIEIVQPF